jgi:hypothetical protein
MALARMGVHLLINDTAELRSAQLAVWIAGVDDPPYFGCEDLAQATLGVPEGSFKVLLAHIPEPYDEAVGDAYSERRVPAGVCLRRVASSGLAGVYDSRSGSVDSADKVQLPAGDSCDRTP